MDSSGHCTSIIVINDIPLMVVVSPSTVIPLNIKNISKLMFFLRYPKRLKWDNGIRNKKLKTRQRVKIKSKGF